MIKSILGVGSIIKFDGEFLKVERLYDDRFFNQFAQCSQKGKLVADLPTRAIKWNGTQFIVDAEKL